MEKTYSPASFAARYAAQAFQLPASGADVASAHMLVMERLTEEERAAIYDARRFQSDDDYYINYSFSSSGAKSIKSQTQAAYYIESVERLQAQLRRAMAKADALKAYYTQTAALMAATKKAPAFVLDRESNRYGDKKIKYKILRGFYDLTLSRLVIEDHNFRVYEGKQHREARAEFEKLTRETAGAYGFECAYYCEKVTVDAATIKPANA